MRDFNSSGMRHPTATSQKSANDNLNMNSYGRVVGSLGHHLLSPINLSPATQSPRANNEGEDCLRRFTLILSLGLILPLVQIPPPRPLVEFVS